MQLSMFIIAIIVYNELDNARNADELESTEARMATLKRTVEQLTEALRLQKNQ